MNNAGTPIVSGLVVLSLCHWDCAVVNQECFERPPSRRLCSSIIGRNLERARLNSVDGMQASALEQKLETLQSHTAALEQQKALAEVLSANAL